MSVIRRIAEAAWDEASFQVAYRGRRHPEVAATLQWAAEIAQRPVRAKRFAEGPVRLAFRGNDRQLFSTLARTLGASPCATLGEHDVEAREIPWFQADRAMREGALVLPRWVGLEIDLAVERLDDRRRASMLKAEARGLSPEVVPSSSAIDEFFNDFYEPTAIARHGDDAFVRRVRYLKRGAERGSILFVRERERRAGALLVQSGDAIDAWVTGVKGGDYEENDNVVRDALYVFCMRHARSIGARTLGLTAAPPFLGDGLLRYKRSFGAHAVPLRSSPMAVRLDLRRPNDALAAALSRSPPIALVRGKLVGIGLAPSPFTLAGVEGPIVVPDLAAWARAQ